MRIGTHAVIDPIRRKPISRPRDACSIGIARSGAKAMKGELVMNTISEWKRAPGRYALVLGLSTLVSAMANSTSACGLYNMAPAAKPVKSMPQRSGLIPAVYRGSSDGFIQVGHETSAPNSGIVGLWQMSMVSDGISPNPVPEGAVVDFGTVQWHEDGTELMVSGGRPPSTGDVCMGTWEQIGPHTYKLKHVALAWVSSDTPPSMGGPGPSPAQFLGPVIIREVVTLDKSRANYQGNFTLDQYNADESVLLLHVSGMVTGTRVTVD